MKKWDNIYKPKKSFKTCVSLLFYHGMNKTVSMKVCWPVALGIDPRGVGGKEGRQARGPGACGPCLGWVKGRGSEGERVGLV